MTKSTTKRLAPEYRKLSIEVREEIAARLEELAQQHSRYNSPADVVAEIVTLYLPLLEELDAQTKQIREAQIRDKLRELDRG